MGNDKEFQLPVQHIDMRQESFPGVILDLGGGGEGVIGKISGERVVVFDICLEQLEAIRNYAIKLTMHARNLMLLDNSFDSVACFFSMMNVPKRDRGKVLAEAKRVLKPDQKMVVWEAVIPKQQMDDPPVFLVPMEIFLPNGRIIKTSHSVTWRGQDHNLVEYLELAEANGLEVVHTETCEDWFKLILRK